MILTLLLAAAAAPAAPIPAQPAAHTGALANGAAYAVDVPANWNGTLLLWSHGYAAVPPPPEDAPKGVKAWLLQRGYALAGSSYSQGGWAVEQAVVEQKDMLAEFQRRYGKPRRIIAWGHSMGGLISIALAERHPGLVSAALPMCASLSGSIAMMNEGLAAALAFKTLLGEDAAIELVRIADDRRNGQLVLEQVRKASANAPGRARLALVATLAQIPYWVDPKAAEPKSGDDAAKLAEQIKGFPSAAFLPRQDQERRAGGAFSWTDDVDFAALLNRSGERRYVERLYRAAGLSLDEDLRRLAAAEPVRADAKAVAYMAANYSPSGKLPIPTLAVHTIGDGITVANNVSAYAAAVAGRGASANLRSVMVRRAGHCTFTPAETAASLMALEQRLDSGKWRTEPAQLTALGRQSGLGETRFAAIPLAPFLRPYVAPPASR